MQIGNKDVFWNYAATLLKIASSILLLPLVLKMMPSEMVGIWTVFATITTFAALLDFGFNPSFTRNITYIFSGARILKVNGFEPVADDQIVDYGLLKGVVSAMRWLYIRMAGILLLVLATVGTYYIHVLLRAYKGDHQEVYLAWILLCLINTYNIFTLYYDALLQGKGLIKVSKQIIIIGQIIYLIIAALLIYFRFGLVAIVSAQVSSVVIIRWLSYRCFFSDDLKQKIRGAVPFNRREIIKIIYPNAIKIGLTSFGGFLVQKSSILIGALYLTLEEIASYGISMQFISIIAGLSAIYTTTYQPKIAHLRIKNNLFTIRDIYLKGQGVLILTFLVGGLGLSFLGNWGLTLIGSKTHLMPEGFLWLAIVLSFVETNLMIAGNILLTKNEVPFFKASLISGFCIVAGLLICFNLLNLGFLSMIIVPLIVDLIYQAWKWPLEVIKDLKITFRTFGFGVIRNSASNG